jgi:hypothetical protein
MTKKKRFKPRRCIHCGEWYQPNPRAAARQKFCSDPECQKARRRKTARAWRRHNHFPSGEADLARVRVWRGQHPGYWRKHRRRSFIMELLVPLVSLKKTRFGRN